ncbi:MAG TPA: MASE1 domain-containing protein [Solirubrobacteraceae bacterium]|jgi:signal transduction histidine kinase
MTQTELLAVEPAPTGRLVVRLRSPSLRYLGGVLALALAYYCAAKLGQSLRYTASVAAIWPPAGLGIAALYLYGVRWWPGVLIAEIVVNAELLGGASPLPLGSLVGQQAGNMAEILVGAILLRRLIGPRAGLDSAQRVGGMVLALAAATAVSAFIGTLSMLAGDVVEPPEAATFLRTWWLGDFAGALVVVPAALVWVRQPRAAWARIRTWDGAVLIVTVAALSAAAVSSSEPVTYVVFPALMWAAFRLGPPGATVAVALAAGIVIGLTAHDVGPFSKQPIDHRTLSTQVYVVVMALTTLFVTAVVAERERAARELADATRRAGARALEERHRIARDLHDSVSQSLFSTVLETRTAQREQAAGRADELAPRLETIAELTRSAQSEMRAMIFELGSDPVTDGLPAALAHHAAALGGAQGLAIDVLGDPGPLPIGRHAEAELFAIAREALANVFKHAGASAVSVLCEVRGSAVVVEIRDDGRGFVAGAAHAGSFGLESMRGRAEDIGGRLEIASRRGGPTVVRAAVPVERDGSRPR